MTRCDTTDGGDREGVGGCEGWDSTGVFRAWGGMEFSLEDFMRWDGLPLLLRRSKRPIQSLRNT